MGVNSTVGIEPPKQIHGFRSKTNLLVNIKNTVCTDTHVEQRESGFDMNGFFSTCKLVEENNLENCSVNSNICFVGKINVRRLSVETDGTG